MLFLKMRLTSPTRIENKFNVNYALSKENFIQLQIKEADDDTVLDKNEMQILMHYNDILH
jgi:hypothetical protein